MGSLVHEWGLQDFGGFIEQMPQGVCSLFFDISNI